MADTYLPADVRKRIVDVMRERKMTQRELALRIDVNESTISRFLSGKTEKLSEESVIRIARVFNVSTDFILGTTVIPDKKNYDISELGLSVEAAKNLYTGKVNNDVVNRLLENPRFAMVTYMIWMIPLQEDMPHKTRCLLPLALCCWDRTKLPKQYRQPEPLMP